MQKRHHATRHFLPWSICGQGATIEAFPATSAEIDRMSERRMERMLRELGVPDAMAGRTRDAKKEQLRVQIDLPAIRF